jgi:hypothetical protein
MARQATKFEREGRPHINANAMKHRDLLTPGPVIGKLRMKASPYQELACGSSKRKADSVTVSSADSSDEAIKSSTNSDNGQPVKSLKVIHHHFSNGEPSEQSSRSQTPDSCDERRPIAEGPQTGPEKDGLRATPNHLLYKTSSGRWKSTKRQPRKCDRRLEVGERLRERVLRPGKYVNYNPDEQALEPISDNQAAAAIKTEDRPALDEGPPSDHLCTGIACEQSECVSRPGLQNLTSGLPSHDNQVYGIKADSFHASYKHPKDLQTSSRIPHNEPETTSNTAACDLGASSPPLYQTLLLSVREMAANLYPEARYQSEAPKTQDVQTVRASGKLTAKLIARVS